MGVKIIGVGKCLPEKVITNDDISKYIDTTDEWIVERTGISQRHVATTETSLDLAKAAAEQALEGIDKESIDLVIVATITPDHITPSMAAEVKMAVGLPNAVAFDINAACSGFVYGLWIAESLMKGSAAGGSVTNGMKRALVIGTERLTRITNWVDRARAYSSETERELQFWKTTLRPRESSAHTSRIMTTRRTLSTARPTTSTRRSGKTTLRLCRFTSEDVPCSSLR